jgi:CheY-like chemotaxis protein
MTTPAAKSERRARQRRRGAPRREEDVPWTSAPRILLVSADLDYRLKYAALFEEAGFSAYAVSDSVEALKTISFRMPDLVLLGAGSSGPDSFRLLAALRGDACTADVPAVVLTSAHAHADGASPTKSSGATLLLEQGVPADVVLGALDDLTRGTPVERFTRRQLRRTMIALRRVVDEQPPGTATPETAVARWSAVIRQLRTAILGTNAEGAYVAASRGMDALTGYVDRELASTSVFDTTMGAHLPFASVWQAYRAGAGSTGTTTIRDKSGRTIRVAYLFSELTSDLDVLLLAPTV